MIERLLIANRGEIAVRIHRAAAELGINTVAVVSGDDRESQHARVADDVRIVDGTGPAAYMDISGLMGAAADAGCDALHPGYGFLSESATLAEACAAASVAFVGPGPEQLRQLGDKAAARALAVSCDVPVLEGTPGQVSLSEVQAFFALVDAPIAIKALAGGGGRGIRIVTSADAIPSAYERCQSEATRSFGDGRLYTERALVRARHIEVQVVGDGSSVTHLWERDCSIQRRNQKLIEVAPSPWLRDSTRLELCEAACRMASALSLRNLATFEFLVDGDGEGSFYFLEANPRLQVEHTVTEEVTGVDLVIAQLLLAGGATLDDLDLGQPPRPRGFALQARVNAETHAPDGTPTPASGTVTAFEVPSGPGVRVDTCGSVGFRPNPSFDSLLAKVIVRSATGDFGVVTAKAERALAEFEVRGVATNVALLRTVLTHPSVAAGEATTRFVDEHLDELLAAAGQTGSGAEEQAREAVVLDDGMMAVEAPTTGVVNAVAVAVGDVVAMGADLVVVEAMKMEHVLSAPSGGVVARVATVPGARVERGEVLVVIAVDDDGGPAAAHADEIDLGRIRSDLAEVDDRHGLVQDAARPEAVARRRAKAARTARENVEALVDPGTFREYGGLVVAAQRAARPLDELMRKTPADGVVTGFGEVGGALFGSAAAQTCVIAFDDTVLAGTMGEMAREKLHRCLDIAGASRRPVVLLAEGGGGRAGDTDGRVGITGWTLDVACYYKFGQLSGLVPLVGVVNGRCFAANAGVLACCDVIIATKGSNLGVGGPSMVEGGRLGTYAPEDIGPMSVQVPNGVVDILADNETVAVEIAKKYLGYFQGPQADWECADQRAARFAVPENRLRGYDVRQVIRILADTDSVLEIRAGFGVGMVTALARIEGAPLGIIANNPLHLGGAIDSEAADKASRFMRLCEAFDLPILLLCDTPGVMVGPDAERSATVRKMGRMFVTGANLTVPFFTIVLRKAYGIGAELMAGGWFKAPRFTVSWPTGEFGGMNIEGNVKLGHAAELAAIDDPVARQALFEKLVDELHEVGRALSVATHFEVDDVIDPAESRDWVRNAMAAPRRPLQPPIKKVPFVDPW